MEKKLDATPVVEEPKSKADLKKESISSGRNVASNAVPPSDLKGDQVLDPSKIAKHDDRATKTMCNGKNGHPGVDCKPMPVCQGVATDKVGETCRNPGPPSSQPPSRSISNPSGIPEMPLPSAVPPAPIEKKDGNGVLSVDPKEVAKASPANATTTSVAKKAVASVLAKKNTTATASF